MPKKEPGRYGGTGRSELLMRLGGLHPASARAPRRLPCGPNLKNRPKQHNNVKGLQLDLGSDTQLRAGSVTCTRL